MVPLNDIGNIMHLEPCLYFLGCCVCTSISIIPIWKHACKKWYDLGVSSKLSRPQNQYVAMEKDSVCMGVGTYIYRSQ